MALGILNDDYIKAIANRIRTVFNIGSNIKVADINDYIGVIPKFEDSIVSSVASKITFGSLNKTVTIRVHYTSIEDNGQCMVKTDTFNLNSTTPLKTSGYVVRGTAINITVVDSSYKIDTMSGSWYGSNVASDGKSARIVCSPTTEIVSIKFV